VPLITLSYAKTAAISSRLSHVDAKPNPDCAKENTGSFRIVNHTKALLKIQLYYVVRSSTDGFFGSVEEGSNEFKLDVDSGYTVPVVKNLHYNVYAANAPASEAPVHGESPAIEPCRLTRAEIR